MMRSIFIFLGTLGLCNQLVFGETPHDFLTRFQKESGIVANVERGARFYQAKHGNDWSCSSCHTDNPLSSGQHAKTSKVIQPLAPAANHERFTDLAKVEKWFRRNCNDVLGRECSAGEKADVLAFLLSKK